VSDHDEPIESIDSEDDAESEYDYTENGQIPLCLRALIGRPAPMTTEEANRFAAAGTLSTPTAAKTVAAARLCLEQQIEAYLHTQIPLLLEDSPLSTEQQAVVAGIDNAIICASKWQHIEMCRKQEAQDVVNARRRESRQAAKSDPTTPSECGVSPQPAPLQPDTTTDASNPDVAAADGAKPGNRRDMAVIAVADALGIDATVLTCRTFEADAAGRYPCPLPGCGKHFRTLTQIRRRFDTRK
jgi:hypothetical protein